MGFALRLKCDLINRLRPNLQESLLTFVVTSAKKASNSY